MEEEKKNLENENVQGEGKEEITIMAEEKNQEEVKQEEENTKSTEEGVIEGEVIEDTNNQDMENVGINISEEVVATIASIAASEVNGVASMSGGFVGGLSEILGKKSKGVKVQVGEKDTVIDINLVVEYGARIPDVAWEVQNKVKTQVESMTGLNVVNVSIHVQGIALPDKKQKKENVIKQTEEKDQK